jgi:outer membrane protein TolC
MTVAVPAGLVLVLSLSTRRGILAQEEAPPPRPLEVVQHAPPVQLPPLEPCDRPYPINLPTALKLAHTRPIDIAIASERIHLAAAQLQRARVLWLPTIVGGVDYFRHDGRIQDTPGAISDTDKSTFMAGVGPTTVFYLTDALFGPLAAKQLVSSREANLQAVNNDTMLAVAEAYLNVQQARGELGGALDSSRRAEELVGRAEKLAPGLVLPVEAVRARTELSHRRQAAVSATERWHVASAELSRILRLDPSCVVSPLEPPDIQVTLVCLDQPVSELVPLALTHRPELAAQQALVQQTIQLLRQEKFRPLLPSILLRGAATNPAGTLAAGTFGGGRDSFVGNFGARNSVDIMALWELQNLGFGNCARVRERRSEKELAHLELIRIQDRVAAEVAAAHAQAVSAAARIGEAEIGLKYAVESVDRNFEGLSQTKRLGGNVLILVIRPQEVVAAIQALAQAYVDYYTAIADYNRAQFRLYRALGHPAQQLACEGQTGVDGPPTRNSPGASNGNVEEAPPVPSAGPAP